MVGKQKVHIIIFNNIFSNAPGSTEIEYFILITRFTLKKNLPNHLKSVTAVLYNKFYTLSFYRKNRYHGSWGYLDSSTARENEVLVLLSTDTHHESVKQTKIPYWKFISKNLYYTSA